MGNRMNHTHITLERLYLFMGRWENNRFAEDEGFSGKRNYIKLIKYILIAGFVIVGSRGTFGLYPRVRIECRNY
jgi:hypothetical protein